VIVDALPTKLAWKRGINLNLAVKWTNKLSEEVEGKSTRFVIIMFYSLQ
jgi:hypothetical protein